MDISGILNVHIAAFHHCGACLPGWTNKNGAIPGTVGGEHIFDLLAATHSRKYCFNVLASNCDPDPDSTGLAVHFSSRGPRLETELSRGPRARQRNSPPGSKSLLSLDGNFHYSNPATAMDCRAVCD